MALIIINNFSMIFIEINDYEKIDNNHSNGINDIKLMMENGVISSIKYKKVLSNFQNKEGGYYRI